jgi:S1-C subfamily serine protease
MSTSRPFIWARPASKAGLQHGDIITKLGDIAMDETHSYINTLYSYKPGDQISLEVYRGGKTVQLQITLGETSPGS